MNLISVLEYSLFAVTAVFGLFSIWAAWVTDGFSPDRLRVEMGVGSDSEAVRPEVVPPD